jgi:hypothetical protein
MQRCMSCLENFSRSHICLCQGCKVWYCSECHLDHTPCNADNTEEFESDNNAVDEVEKEIDDSRPGIWIVKLPEATREPFNIWNYIKDTANVEAMLSSY